MWGHTLLHLDDIQGPGGPFSQGGISSIPDVFTPWREKVGQIVMPLLECIKAWLIVLLLHQLHPGHASHLRMLLLCYQLGCHEDVHALR
jgi:hypothetical protein